MLNNDVNRARREEGRAGEQKSMRPLGAAAVADIAPRPELLSRLLLVVIIVMIGTIIKRIVPYYCYYTYCYYSLYYMYCYYSLYY